MDKIKFEAEIDFSQPQGIVKIKAIENPWADFGYLLEIMSFMSKVVMDHEEKSKEEILQYVHDYLNRAIHTYKAR